MIELRFDYGFGEVDTGLIKLELNTPGSGTTSEQNQTHSKSNDLKRTQDSEHNMSSNGSGTGPSGTCVLEKDKSPVDDSSPCSTATISTAPICRQFWKAGVYNEDSTNVSKTRATGSRIYIHPKFLHSNATSHKWAFGAIAELIDNAVDEIQNGATIVVIDKTLNPRNGSPALLIQDNGAGMSPVTMQKCLSFGFSDKKSDSAIGKYGNGFKTSSMRLGADAIVFSRNYTGSTLTQSIGLLSYTFLTRLGYDDVVVPMVHYKVNLATGLCEPQPQSGEESNSNLSVLLQWSPYSTEEQLLNQFDDVGPCGTKVIIYNLWLDDEGNMELDFESDPKDIRIGWDGKTTTKENSLKAKTENHIANRLKYSLRAYLSILYLKLPETFCILLRGNVVLYNNIALDLKHPEFISYKAHGCKDSVITTVGFLKEAPDVNIHGFSIYHKRRLILPYLPVVSSNKGRGVVGVLEADFIEPTHNKQDFEKTNVYQKLVNRLREMTNEYWDFHCELIGYQTPRKARCTSASPSAVPKKTVSVDGSKSAPIITEVGSRAALYASPPIIKPTELAPGFTQASNLKRKLHDQPQDYHTGPNTPDSAHYQKKITVMQENKKLHEKCLGFEKAEEELHLKIMQLKTELEAAQLEYATLSTELQGFGES